MFVLQVAAGGRAAAAVAALCIMTRWRSAGTWATRGTATLRWHLSPLTSAASTPSSTSGLPSSLPCTHPKPRRGASCPGPAESPRVIGSQGRPGRACRPPRSTCRKGQVQAISDIRHFPPIAKDADHLWNQAKEGTPHVYAMSRAENSYSDWSYQRTATTQQHVHIFNKELRQLSWQTMRAHSSSRYRTYC